ncbi:MAG: hypothetical protein DSY80_07140 [Desulfocapsa sp.]|nr:MAG: hypothetical protein DSY80_07140 [Desulfocapsa sp.]
MAKAIKVKYTRHVSGWQGEAALSEQNKWFVREYISKGRYGWGWSKWRKATEFELEDISDWKELDNSEPFRYRLPNK